MIPQVTARTVRRGLAKTNWIFPHPYRLSHILDLGANVGLSSLVYRVHWPSAMIRAVEPDTATLSVLQRNMRPWYVEVRAGAFGDGRMFHDATPRKVRSAVHRYVPTNDPHEDGAVASRPLSEWFVTMPRWNRRSGVLVKMDVEGAEQSLFEAAVECAWFALHVNAFHMEVHPGCLDAGLEFLKILGPKWNIGREVDTTQGRFWGYKNG